MSEQTANLRPGDAERAALGTPWGGRDGSRAQLAPAETAPNFPFSNALPQQWMVEQPLSAGLEQQEHPCLRPARGPWEDAVVLGSFFLRLPRAHHRMSHSCEQHLAGSTFPPAWTLLTLGVKCPA